MSITSNTLSGKINCITGPMFSGKSSYLLQQVDGYRAQGMKVAVFKPRTDKRYLPDSVCTHDGQAIQAVLIDSSADISVNCQGYDVICLDEIQFLDDQLTQEVCKLKTDRKTVFLSGLSYDFKQEEFGPMLSLIKIADKVIHLTGQCSGCNNPSTHTFRKSNSEQLIELGASDEYLALCKACYDDEQQLKKMK